METVKKEELDLNNGQERMKVKIDTGLDVDDRKQITQGLSRLVANSYMLMLKTHFYHWNVKGSLFLTIHELTEEQYNELFEAIDNVAERIRALGFDAPGTLAQFNDLSTVSDGKIGASQDEILKDLLQSQESIAKLCYSIIPMAEKAGDEVTVDMLIERVTVHEKAAWMWRSFLEV